MSTASPLDKLFKGRHFLGEVILAHTTVLRWVQRYAPEFEKKWQQYAHLIGPSWRVDETYIKVKGEWTYLYRGVDKAGNSTVFHLSRKRNVSAMKTYLRKASKMHRPVTLDGYQASHRAVREYSDKHQRKKPIIIRSSKYLNNLIEQDHHAIKSRTGPMLGFQNFDSACVTIVGIELLHRIRQGQFDLKRLGLEGKTAPEIWNAVLTA